MPCKQLSIYQTGSLSQAPAETQALISFIFKERPMTQKPARAAVFERKLLRFFAVKANFRQTAIGIRLQMTR